MALLVLFKIQHNYYLKQVTSTSKLRIKQTLGKLNMRISLFSNRHRKNWVSYNNFCNCPKNGTVRFYNAVMCSKDVDPTVKCRF